MRALVASALAASCSEKPVLEMFSRPLFEAQNERVGLRQMIGNDVGRLRGTDVGEQVARDDGGQFRTGSADQPECEIEMPHRCAGRDAHVRRHQHPGLVEQDIRIALPKQRREPPGRGRFLMIEKPGLRQDERADAGRARCRAPSACHLRRCALAWVTSGRASAGINFSGLPVLSAGTMTQSGFKSARDGLHGYRQSLAGPHSPPHARQPTFRNEASRPFAAAEKLLAIANASSITVSPVSHNPSRARIAIRMA